MGNQKQSTIDQDMARLLRCPACQSPLEQRDERCRCPICGKDFPSVRGVLRFVGTQNYADSFGYQWHEFSTTQLLPDYAEMNFRRKTGLRVEQLKGKVVLDIGCGMGRFAEVATRWGAKVVGIDLSAAVEMAARNLGDRSFLALQADVLALPFAPESFDCIYSIGVLHHTPDAERAFKNLPQYLKPGGSLAVWLYSGYNKWYRFSDHYRKITHRLPIRWLHAFLRIVVPILYWLDCGLRAIPLVGKPLAGVVRYLFPVSLVRNSEVRILDTLDWYSPKYQSKHTYEEVFRWFESCGLEDLSVAEVSIGVRARKPIRNSGSSSRNGSQSQDMAVDFANAVQRSIASPMPGAAPRSVEAPNRVS